MLCPVVRAPAAIDGLESCSIDGGWFALGPLVFMVAPDVDGFGSLGSANEECTSSPSGVSSASGTSAVVGLPTLALLGITGTRDEISLIPTRLCCWNSFTQIRVKPNAIKVHGNRNSQTNTRTP